MSTIKSSDEHLTLNADGSSKDIKFQANGVEKASISSSGAFTSTTIDATKLTGDLPAISGANLTGVGVAGISSSADATAMTITSAEKIGVGVTDPDATFEVANSTTDYAAHFGSRVNATGDNVLAITSYDENPSNTSYLIRCTTNTGVAGAGNDRFAVMADGRGLSQFTAKAWVNFRGSSTVVINDSHNVSSISDNGTGNYTLNLSNNLGNDHGVMSGHSIMDGLVYGDANNVSSAGSFRMRTVVGYSNALMDSDEVHCIVFGD